MTDNPERQHVYDPEADGLPDTVDPDSTAYDEHESGREADGPDPTPITRGAPLGLDGWGTTPAEARAGMPLDRLLARERPDVTDHSRGALDDETADVLDVDSDEDVYESVGRLVAEDDDGLGRSGEATAFDVGMAGGGESAEEAAMHIEDPAAERNF